MRRKLEEIVRRISDMLDSELFAPLDQVVRANASIRDGLNPAFPFPRKIRMGILKKFFVLEFIGPEELKDEAVPVSMEYQPTYSVHDFLGISCHCAHKIPVSTNFLDNIAIYMGDSISYLCEYFYDFTQMPMEMFILNGDFDLDSIIEPVSISNVTFFWTDVSGDLKIKHVDFMEIWPLDENGDLIFHDRVGLHDLGQFLLNYKVPTYNLKLHKELNELIELVNLATTTEVDITQYLENHPQILQIAFGAHNLNPQILLEWQYETELSNLKPDFMPERMDGYCDILEFKTPTLKNAPMVGPLERHHPSSEVDRAIAQIDAYEQWCGQEINLQWLEREKGIKVKYPQRILVMGHSKNFPSSERQRIRDIRNTSIFTYDEFIEMARFQIYRVR